MRIKSTKSIGSKNNNILNNITIKSILIFSLLFFISCTKEKKIKENFYSYQAISRRDTANLTITMSDHYFKGEFKIIYGSKAIMDSGYVRGKIVGDTLIGNYYYISYGGQGECMPITLLKKNKKLIFGSGALTKWLGFRYFDTDVPIDYEAPRFVFEKIK